ncbi:transcriptional regulator with CopG/Arc/MetJ DNA-binding domain and metal-binding domain protein [Nostoc piscinale CENA21]|uniref:Transcriptional regulator with CopG/Arc/MetJ DNA-binding domain and metal-binding domain protein n=1 Tax=Nostoc piscinale CENA21 TaxID=224013 RepID=A0A0M4SZU7_9NOSO|nr:ribbon-helix-helix domain-containing protein [Nostoc piscinale]ALF55109.1 transcriptional regulator with CopG/Arc/MetJ DNA-binding domain and metal-binding domain protein [Nostoc piscinale CENA21]
MKAESVRTTLAIPRELLEATDKAVLEGKARSRNDFMVQAIRRELAAQKRAAIDAALTEMACDPDYQAEVLKLETEFAAAQWEAFLLEESL